MTFKLEAGKYYVSRNGGVFGPLAQHRSQGSYKWICTTYNETFGGKGEYRIGCSSEANDLVEEYQPPLASAQQKTEPGWKQDGGKARIDLIAPEFIFGTSEILAFGAQKYADRNWEKGMSWSRCFGALMRHLWVWWGGEQNDKETGKSHLWHASCCLMFLIAYEQRKIGTDDRKVLDTSS